MCFRGPLQFLFVWFLCDLELPERLTKRIPREGARVRQVQKSCGNFKYTTPVKSIDPRRSCATHTCTRTWCPSTKIPLPLSRTETLLTQIGGGARDWSNVEAPSEIQSAAIPTWSNAVVRIVQRHQFAPSLNWRQVPLNPLHTTPDTVWMNLPSVSCALRSPFSILLPRSVGFRIALRCGFQRITSELYKVSSRRFLVPRPCCLSVAKRNFTARQKRGLNLVG